MFMLCSLMVSASMVLVADTSSSVDSIPRLLRERAPVVIQPSGVALLPVLASFHWNEYLPRSVSEGALWAGRGKNIMVQGGLTLRSGALAVSLAPEMAWAENKPFEYPQYGQFGRSLFASPFHGLGPHSMDLPLRHGEDPISTVGPGSSSLYLESKRLGIRAGLSGAPLWWGPLPQNALLLSPSAPGVPRATLEGMHITPVGGITWSLFQGVLSNSSFFRDDVPQGRRTLTGLGMTLTPKHLPNTTVGWARIAVTPNPHPDTPAEPFFSFDEPPKSDQLTGVFFQWSHRDSGLALGGELAWQEPPTSLRSILSHLGHSRGLGLSVDWNPPPTSTYRGWYARGEVVSLNLARVRYDRRMPPDFYSGFAAPEGFTQKGRLLGAPVGPGGQTVWIEAGRPVVQKAVLGGRFGWTRYENNALARTRPNYWWWRDASFEWAVQLRRSEGPLALSVDAGVQRRFNAFHAGVADPWTGPTQSQTNHFVSMGLEWVPGERELEANPVQARSPMIAAACPGPGTPWHAPGDRWSQQERSCALARGGGRHTLVTAGDPGGSGWLRIAPLTAATHWNQAFPYSHQAGGVWKGRGLTAELSFGAALVAGPLLVRVEPRAFWAQNSAFDLPPMPDRVPFGYPYIPQSIDLPVRFGEDTYGRVMPGNSLIQLQFGALQVGATTAQERWGPAEAFPALLGHGAEGIPRVYFGLDHGSLGPLGRVNLRAFTGQATASPFSPGGPKHQSQVVGFVGLWQSPGPGNLELGGGRIEHERWTGWPSFSQIVREPFGGLLDDHLEANTSDENGLVTLFGRWRIPEAGVEVYGEWGRDDWWGGLWDLTGEPMHTSTFLVGAARGWLAGSRLHRFRMEQLFARQAQDEPLRSRPPLGIHSSIVGGHTNRGGILGSTATVMGGGLSISYQTVTAQSHWEVTYRKEDQGEEWTQRANRPLAAREHEGRGSDVLHGLYVEYSRMMGRGLVFEGKVGGQQQLQRYFLDDTTNWTLSFGVHWLPAR